MSDNVFFTLLNWFLWKRKTAESLGRYKNYLSEENNYEYQKNLEKTPFKLLIFSNLEISIVNNNTIMCSC